MHVGAKRNKEVLFSEEIELEPDGGDDTKDENDDDDDDDDGESYDLLSIPVDASRGEDSVSSKVDSCSMEDTVNIITI